MAVEIVIPDLGPAIESVKLVKWLKREGDAVSQGEAICEVETDKTVTEIESTATGVVLKQVVVVDSEISPAAVIAYVGEAGESVPE